jgi:hypothetical protein
VADDNDPELTERALRDLDGLGKVAKRLALVWLRKFSRGELAVVAEPLYLPDPALRSVRMSGGLTVVFRPLRAEELAQLQRRRPQILIVCVVPARELAIWQQAFLQQVSDTRDE